MIVATRWELIDRGGVVLPVFLCESDDIAAERARLGDHFVLPEVVLDAQGRPCLELSAPDLGVELGRIGPFPSEVQGDLDRAQRTLDASLILIQQGDDAIDLRRFAMDVLLDFSGEEARAAKLVDAGQPEAARGRLEALIGREPPPAGVYFHLARCYRALGKPEDALRYLTHEVERCTDVTGRPMPLASRAFALEGELLAELGRGAEAAAAYERALAVRPNHVEALAGLADLRLADGDVDAALACVERARRVRPDHPALTPVLGRLQAEVSEVERRLAAAEPIELRSSEARVSPEGRRRIYRVLARVAHCDGDVDPSERRLLEVYRERFGLEVEDANVLEQEALETQQLTLGTGEEEQALLLRLMIEVATADGRLAPQEERQLHRVGELVGIPRAEVARRIDQAFARGSDVGLAPDLAPDRLALLAYLGHVEAREVLGDSAPDQVAGLTDWVAGLARWGKEPVVRAALAAAGLHEAALAAAHPDERRPADGLAAARAYLANPGEATGNATIMAGASASQASLRLPDPFARHAATAMALATLTDYLTTAEEAAEKASKVALHAREAERNRAGCTADEAQERVRAAVRDALAPWALG